MKILKEYNPETKEPAEGECIKCGMVVYLTTSDNECDCGEIYNLFGQHLAPRDQWEELPTDDDGFFD